MNHYLKETFFNFSTYVKELATSALTTATPPMTRPKIIEIEIIALDIIDFIQIITIYSVTCLRTLPYRVDSVGSVQDRHM